MLMSGIPGAATSPMSGSVPITTVPTGCGSPAFKVPALQLPVALAAPPRLALVPAPQTGEPTEHSGLSAGDVLLTGGMGQLQHLGTAGGLLGHALLILDDPTVIQWDSPEGRELSPILTKMGFSGLSLQVETVESTRNERGLHHSFTLLHVDMAGKVYIIGERSLDGQKAWSQVGEPVSVDLWQCPQELRRKVQRDLVREVTSEMMEDGESWSLATAVRAVFLSASEFSSTTDQEQLLQEIQGCWGSKPICTTVVIAFWQRLLCKLEGDSATAAEAILRWMPLKADRGLPGELLETMRSVGWRQLRPVPGINAQGHPHTARCTVGHDRRPKCVGTCAGDPVGRRAFTCLG